MTYDFRWGGLSIRKLSSEVWENFWMVIVSMVITFLSISIMAELTSVPSYTSSAVVAVYPFDTLYTLDASTDSVDAAKSVSSIFNSAAFQAGLEEQIGKSDDRIFISTQISNSNMLMLDSESSSSADAYITVRTAIDYYSVYSNQLPGDVELEVISQPDISYLGDNKSKLLKYRALMTLFVGVSASSLLVLMYLARKTYKTEKAFRHFYKNIPVYPIPSPGPENTHFFKKKKERQSILYKEMVRKTAIEMTQILRSVNGKSILITSAVKGEGKTSFALSMARELSLIGKRIIIFEVDMIQPSLKSFIKAENAFPEISTLDLLKGKGDVRKAILEESENLQVIFSEFKDVEDDFFYTSADADLLIEELEKLADIVLIIGESWKNSTNVKIWQESVDVILTICRQDKADFAAEDQMIEEVYHGNTFFAGSILEGFV